MSSSSKKTVNDLDDEDSENDSDYCPENDPEADHDVEDDEGTTGLSTISFGRKRKAADEWAAMQENSAPVANNTTAGSTSKASKKKKSSGKKNTDILAAIFGKKASAKIMNSAPSSQTSKMDANRIKEAARESYQTLQKKTIVKETRKFAGQEIT